jgi:hypothetical protein
VKFAQSNRIRIVTGPDLARLLPTLGRGGAGAGVKTAKSAGR